MKACVFKIVGDEAEGVSSMRDYSAARCKPVFQVRKGLHIK